MRSGMLKRHLRAVSALGIVLAAGSTSVVLAASSRDGKDSVDAVRAAPAPTRAAELPATNQSRLPPIIHRPLAVAATAGVKLPLLIVLHGSSGTPSAMVQLTHLNRIANQRHFVVAYLATADQAHPWKSPSDLPYISSEIDQLIATQNIDPKRVYATGFSVGGRAVYELGCLLSTKVAAIAVVEGGFAYPLYSSCVPSRPISELLIVGDADHQFYSGLPNRLPPAGQTTARWVQINQCWPQAVKRSQIATVFMEEWVSCTDRATVGEYIVHGGGHTWPYVGATDSSAPAQFDASVAVWAFVSAHSLGPATPGAKLLSLRASRSHRKRVLTATLQLTEPLSIRERLLKSRATRPKTFHLQPGSRVKMTYAISHATSAGRFVVSFAVRDAYNRQLTFTRSIRLPKP
jgi:polyhydroxybutyrate depolymerase